MKVNLSSLSLSMLILVAIKTDFTSCIPLAGPADSSKSSPDPDASAPVSPSTRLATTTGESVPLLIFPRDSTVYKITENDTALRILQARSADTTVTEQINAVKQRKMKSGNESNISLSPNTNQSSTSSPIDGYDDDAEENDDDEDEEYSEEDTELDNDVENVQPKDPNREDGLEEQFGDKNSHYPLVIDNSTIELSAMRQEHVWIIMLGAIIVTAVGVYIAMTLYRNRLERRYGMRQRLVTEDDYYTNNDI